MNDCGNSLSFFKPMKTFRFGILANQKLHKPVARGFLTIFALCGGYLSPAGFAAWKPLRENEGSCKGHGVGQAAVPKRGLLGRERCHASESVSKECTTATA